MNTIHQTNITIIIAPVFANRDATSYNGICRLLIYFIYLSIYLFSITGSRPIWHHMTSNRLQHNADKNIHTIPTTTLQCPMSCATPPSTQQVSDDF